MNKSIPSKKKKIVHIQAREQQGSIKKIAKLRMVYWLGNKFDNGEGRFESLH